MPSELHDVARASLGLRVQDGVTDNRQPVGPQELTKSNAVDVGRENQCRQQLATVGAFAGGYCTIHQRVQALIEGEREPEGHLTVRAAVEPLVAASCVSIGRHVCPCQYVRYMSMRGISDLIVAIMAAGDVDALDARRPRLAHEALVAVANAGTPAALAVLRRFGVEVTWSPDPDVGRRVEGLTSATWAAVAAGLLEPHENTQGGWFVLPDDVRREVRRQLARLDPGEVALLHAAGADWATRSTFVKYAETADRSLAKRSLSLA